jgi:O-antigen/teichoic acid export membrane protein
MDRLVTTATVSQGHRDLFLVGVKLMDVAARAGLVLTATYGLRVDQAGQFGLIATLVGLFAFAFNFERQIDIQRRAAGEADAVMDRHVTQALKFFAFNWVLMIPLFVAAVAFWAHPPWPILLLATLVVVGEHLSNQVYQYALINHRYAPMLVVVTLKNAGLAVVLLATALFMRPVFDLAFVIAAWATGAVLCTLVLALMFARLRQAAPKATPFNLTADILGQHRASMTHFLIGLIAVLVLQFDRLAVGGLLTLEQTGLYFRHALLVSLAYQMFGIASFNRITPSIFTAAKVEPTEALARRVLKEYARIMVATPLLFAGLWLADRTTQGVWTNRFHIDLGLLAIMLLGFMLRGLADFPAMILNAKHLERWVLHRQAVAFAIGGVLLLNLTHAYGLWGAAWAMVATSGLYAILNWSVLPRLNNHIGSGHPA